MLHGLGLWASRSGDSETAKKRFREALDVWNAIVGRDHPDAGLTEYELGVVLYRDKDFDGAARLVTHFADVLRKAHGTDDIGALMFPLYLLSMIERQRGELESAERIARETIRLATLFPQSSWVRPLYESNLGACLMAQGKATEALPLIERAWPILADKRGKTSGHAQTTLKRLIECLESLGESDRAAKYRAELAEE